MTVKCNNALINNALNKHMVIYSNDVSELHRFGIKTKPVDPLPFHPYTYHYKLELPEGMKLCCTNGVIYALDQHDEAVLVTDYRIPTHNTVWLPSRKMIPYPLKDELEQLSRQLWIDEGYPNGRALEHWNLAKAQLLEKND